MSDTQPFEARFEEQLRSYAVAGAPTVAREQVARAVAAGVASRSRPRITMPLARTGTQPRTMPQLAAAAVIVLIAAIGFAIWIGGNNAVIPPGGTPLPSATPSPSSSLQPTQALPSPGRYNADRPGPLRSEPDDSRHSRRPGKTHRSVGRRCPDHARARRHYRRSGVGGLLADPTETEACVRFNLADRVSAPLPEPGDQWLGYGLVVDTDADGIGDVRYGVDNVAKDRVQMWRTDLATGESTAAPIGLLEDEVMDAGLPH